MRANDGRCLGADYVCYPHARAMSSSSSSPQPRAAAARYNPGQLSLSMPAIMTGPLLERVCVAMADDGVVRRKRGAILLT